MLLIFLRNGHELMATVNHFDAKVRYCARPWLNLGDRFGSSSSAPCGSCSMRTVAAVVALVVCVHAGLWSSLSNGNRRPPISTAPLASVSYSPYARSQHPTTATARRRSKSGPTSRSRQPVHQHHPHLYVRRAALSSCRQSPREFGLKVTLGIWIDKNEDRNEREIQAAHRARSPLQQHQRDRGRQRDDAARATSRLTN